MLRALNYMYSPLKSLFHNSVALIGIKYKSLSIPIPREPL
jgi:hypothetical protein